MLILNYKEYAIPSDCVVCIRQKHSVHGFSKVILHYQTDMQLVDTHPSRITNTPFKQYND